MDLTIFIIADDSKTEHISFNTRKKEVEIRSKDWVEWFSFDEISIELDGKKMILLEELLKRINNGNQNI